MNSKPNSSTSNLSKPPLNIKKIKPTVTYVPQKTNQNAKTGNQYQPPNGSRPVSHVVQPQKQIKITHPIKPAFQVQKGRFNNKTIIQDPFGKKLDKNKAQEKLQQIVNVCNQAQLMKAQQKLEKIKNILFSKKKNHHMNSAPRTNQQLNKKVESNERQKRQSNSISSSTTNRCEAPSSNYKVQFNSFKTNEKQNKKDSINTAAHQIVKSNNSSDLGQKFPQSQKLRFTVWSGKQQQIVDNKKKLIESQKLPINKQEEIENLLSPFSISQKKQIQGQQSQGRFTVIDPQMLISQTKQKKGSETKEVNW